MGLYQHLTRSDRNLIEKWLEQETTIVEIASRLHVHRSTIDRELKRVPEDLLYDADHAHEQALSKTHAGGAKSKWSPRLAHQIECDLEDSWSPEQIAHERHIVAFKTIYNWLEKGLLNVSTECLRHKGRRKQKQAEKRGKMTVGHTIDQRPATINSREEFGHWELDTVVSGRGKSKACDATFLERKTRFYWAIPMIDRSAAAMKAAIKTFSVLLGNSRALLSVTVDRGKEFACWHEIETELNMPMYFCDPHAPWQRGSNENGNGLYREFFEKGIDFSKVSASDRMTALRKMNTRPKKTLGWKTCMEMFHKEMLRLI